jgi:hypothetical protein
MSWFIRVPAHFLHPNSITFPWPNIKIPWPNLEFSMTFPWPNFEKLALWQWIFNTSHYHTKKSTSTNCQKIWCKNITSLHTQWYSWGEDLSIDTKYDPFCYKNVWIVPFWGLQSLCNVEIHSFCISAKLASTAMPYSHIIAHKTLANRKCQVCFWAWGNITMKIFSVILLYIFNLPLLHHIKIGI